MHEVRHACTGIARVWGMGIARGICVIDGPKRVVGVGCLDTCAHCTVTAFANVARKAFRAWLILTPFMTCPTHCECGIP